MRITDIKRQVKRVDRYSIYIDGKYSFPLGESEVLNLGLKVGQEYDKVELEELKQKAIIDKGYDRALNLIAHRPRSRWELDDYLKRKDYSKEDAQAILNKLSEAEYINDLDFARRWVASRRLLKSTSKRRLIQELRQKRVSSDIIERVVQEDETSELDVLKELVERKRRQAKYQDNLKLMQYLSRQGFNYGDIKLAVEEIKEKEQPEN